MQCNYDSANKTNAVTGVMLVWVSTAINPFRLVYMAHHFVAQTKPPVLTGGQGGNPKPKLALRLTGC